MNINKIITPIITVTVAVIMLAAVLIPVVDDAKNNSGPSVVYTNTASVNQPYHYSVMPATSFTLTYSDGWAGSINGQSVAKGADSSVILFTDGLSVELISTGDIHYFTGSGNMVANSEGTVTFTFDKGTYSIVGGASGELKTGTYSWLAVVHPHGEYVAHTGPLNNVYYRNADDFVIMGGYYQDGNLDTQYSYFDGNLSFSVPAYSGTVNLDSNLIDGTVNVRQISTCSLTVTDGSATESFTPFRTLVKETIIGNEESAQVGLYNTIPVLIIVALLVGLIGLFVTRKN